MKKILFIPILLFLFFFGKKMNAGTIDVKNFNIPEINNNVLFVSLPNHLGVKITKLDSNFVLLCNDFPEKINYVPPRLEYKRIIDPQDELLYSIVNYDVFSSYVYPLPTGTFSDSGFVMSPLFMPLVFDNVRKDYKIKRTKYFKKKSLSIPSPVFNTFTESMKADRFIRTLAEDILIEEEMKNIDRIKYDNNKLEKYEKLVFHLNAEEPPSWSTIKVYSNLKNINDTIKLPSTEYNPWSKKGVARIHFSQTHLSGNWSKGGESNTAGWSQINYSIDYNDLKYIKFENTLDIKLGINTTDKDTIRGINISTDQFRLTNKLNVKWHNDWYYTLSSDFLTQILNNYKTNTNELKTSFLSPAKLFIGLGASYKKKTKKYNISLDLTPLTSKINYVNDIKNMNETSYGIKEGKHFGYELGAKISTDFTFNLTDEISYKTKFYYFSDFSYVDADWENTIAYDLFGIISAQLYIDTRLDDRVKRDPGESAIEFHEMLSFGLSYFW